jgi:LysM repeat protein
MTERALGTPRLLKSALATSTIPLMVLGSAALAAPAWADAPRQTIAPRSASPVNIDMAQVRLASGSLATSLPAAFTSSTAVSAAKAPATYTVKSGDTLTHIAVRHGMGLSVLLQANGLPQSSTIYPGQQLKVSGTGAATTASSASTGSAATTYTVKSGETLLGIATRHGVGLSALLQANGLSQSSTIYAGQQLKVSGTAATTSTATHEDVVPNTFLHYTYPDHVVRDANANKRAVLSAGVPSRSQMQAIIADTARTMGVDPSLALAHSFTESSFNHASVSPANAIGAMQVIPASGKWASALVGRELNLLDPYDNAVAGVAIIRQLQRTAGSLDVGIAAYYQGLGGVQRNGMYPDTQDYVAKVKGYMQRF